jgi:Tfp pilus assembly protein PilO
MIVGGSFFLSYYFLFESSEKSLESAKKEEREIRKEIREYKDYLLFHDDFEISKLEKEIEELKREVSEFDIRKNYIEIEVSKLKKVIYNQTSWTGFINSISKEAENIGVEVERIENSYMNSGETFANRLSVALQLKANYLNTILFIDKLERSNLIVNVENIDMAVGEDESVSTKLFLSVWGING